MSTSSGAPAPIPLSSLSIAQVDELRQRTEQEIDSLNTNLMTLKYAKGEFGKSKVAVDTLVRPELVGSRMLVPLTASVYVPGELADGDRVMIDVGAGYLTEVSTAHARKHFDQKIEFVTNQIDTLQVNVAKRRATFEALNVHFLERQKASQASGAE